MATQIRLATSDDAEQIRGIYTPLVAHTAITFETEVPEIVEVARRVERTLAALPWLVCEQDEAILGYAYAARHRVRTAYQWSIESSVYIDSGCRRRGTARALYDSLFAILKLQRYRNVCAGITLPNPASIRLHEAYGFEPVGVYRSIGFKLGAWHDVAWYQLALLEHSPAPEPPRSLPEVQRRSDFLTALNSGTPHIRL